MMTQMIMILVMKDESGGRTSLARWSAVAMMVVIMMTWVIR
jgi:hypothetical protein